MLREGLSDSLDRSSTVDDQGARRARRPAQSIPAYASFVNMSRERPQAMRWIEGESSRNQDHRRLQTGLEEHGPRAPQHLERALELVRTELVRG